MRMPKISLLQWQKRYGAEKACISTLAKYRWPNGKLKIIKRHFKKYNITYKYTPYFFSPFQTQQFYSASLQVHQSNSSVTSLHTDVSFQVLCDRVDPGQGTGQTHIKQLAFWG